MAPRAKQCDKQRLTIPRIPRPQFLPQIRQFGRRDQIIIQILHHDARKLYILVFFKTICHCAIDALGTEVDAELADDEVAAGFEQAAIGAEEFEKVHHEEGEVGVVAVFGDLGEELEVAGYDGVGGVGEGFEEGGEGAVVGGEGLWWVSWVVVETWEYAYLSWCSCLQHE